MKEIGRLAVDPPRPPSQDATFQNEDWLREAVAAAGFAGTVVTRSTVHSDFRDRDHFLAWVGSHAGHQVLRRVPEQRRPELLDALATIFPGRPSISTRIHLVVAGKPGPAT